jgi:hypothetical protein
MRRTEPSHCGPSGRKDPISACSGARPPQSTLVDAHCAAHRAVARAEGVELSDLGRAVLRVLLEDEEPDDHAG